MAEIVELIAADHLHIMRWQERLAELRHRPGEPGDALLLTAIWDTLASLIDLHMAADEEVCGPAVYGSGPAGLELVREVAGAHEGIREIIRETGRYPAGSPRWWELATAALAAWTRCLHREVHGPLADCRRRISPALRAQLARQWRAYMDTRSATGTRTLRRRSRPAGSARPEPPPWCRAWPIPPSPPSPASARPVPGSSTRFGSPTHPVWRLTPASPARRA